jgi:hypothetical protein
MANCPKLSYSYSGLSYPPLQYFEKTQFYWLISSVNGPDSPDSDYSPIDPLLATNQSPSCAR